MIGYMTRPEKLKDDAVKDMEQVVRDYPYFAIGQALLSVAYMNVDDKRYEQQLKRASSCVPSRDKLRQFTLLARHRLLSEPLTPTLPDEFVPKDNVSSSTESNTQDELQGNIIREKVFIIPEIDLRGSHEELSAEMALLEEKRKSLDELKAIIAARLREIEIEIGRASCRERV